jgi:SAM-dependent methyltransferase
MIEAAAEINRGQRFEFGKNWRRFLERLTEERIAEAERSVRALLDAPDLPGKSFLDAGCGSGLFSLAARRLGARVRSFDYDPQAAACAEELKRRFFPSDPDWTIGTGSVLDEPFIASIGTHDVVYSWGVLHHTGAMFKAMEIVARAVAPDGLLVVSIYNDQGWASRVWRSIKKTYNLLPRPLRFLVLIPCLIRLWCPRMCIDMLRFKPFHTWIHYGRNRGMSPWHDLVDWVGGYPFEVAKPADIQAFYETRGFELVRMKTVGRKLGCNEFVFHKAH